MLGTIGTLRVKWFRNNAHTVHLMHSVAFKDYMYNNVHVLAVSKGQTRFGNSLGGIKKMIIFWLLLDTCSFGASSKSFGIHIYTAPLSFRKTVFPIGFW